jgi:glycosyltransferase involved in cell wall biosynthesis
MKKIVIQIPCFNEEATLGAVLRSLPRRIPGADAVEWLVIDDGSSDRTAEVARAGGADHVLRLPHGGLAHAFMAGLSESLRLGADFIVNIDGDNQYDAADIPKLLTPVLAGQAEISIGARPIDHIRHFSGPKKLFQKIGSRIVRGVSRTSVEDCTSGFRAMSREAALRINIFNAYTYTLEMIIQAGQKNIPVASVPIRVNGLTRPSRLVKSTGSYIGKSAVIILRLGMSYSPARFFAWLGLVPFSAGFLLGIRWVFIRLSNAPTSHVPSLVVAAILVLTGIQLWVFGLMAELISVNRKILEDIQLRTRRLEFKR